MIAVSARWAALAAVLGAEVVILGGSRVVSGVGAACPGMIAASERWAALTAVLRAEAVIMVGVRFFAGRASPVRA
jgi:hypothetical protein